MPEPAAEKSVGGITLQYYINLLRRLPEQLDQYKIVGMPGKFFHPTNDVPNIATEEGFVDIHYPVFQAKVSRDRLRPCQFEIVEPGHPGSIRYAGFEFLRRQRGKK
jgi:hypothetical protein